MPFCSIGAPPPAHTVDTAPVIPEATANIFSLLFFDWITATLTLGYARPLDPPDLYKLQENRNAKVIGDKISKSFAARVRKADEYNTRLVNGEISPGIRKVWWKLKGKSAERELQWRTKDGQKKASLVLAMNDSVVWWFWTAGILKCFADASQVLSPLLVKVI